MPSFDITSKADTHEISNAVDQANRELEIRFDFRNSGAKFSLDEKKITAVAPTDFHLQQMAEILKTKFSKRSLDVRILTFNDPQTNLKEAKQEIVIRQGLESDEAKTLVKQIKEQKFKVQTSIQGDEVRVSGKKRDDLQAVIAYLREHETKIPLQYENFRD